MTRSARLTAARLTVARLTAPLTLASALAIAAAMAGPALAAAGEDAVIRVGSLYEPQNLDNTAGAGQGINEAFNGNVYEALYRLADSGEVQPVLADSHQISPDGLTHTFTLRQGVTFHSGEPLTAADVKASIERVLAEGSKSSRKKSLANITAVETPDDRTVIVRLSSRSISLPYNLSYVWIVNDSARDITAAEDGTGPYRLEGWTRGSTLTLAPFAAYWGDKPRNGGAQFTYFTEATALNNALLTDAVDVITSVQSPDALAQFADPAAFTIAEGQSTTKDILAWNDRVAPFDNPKVRKALARAIDKKALLEAIWGDRGQVIGSFVPPTDPWYEDLTGIDPYDPDSAKALLAEAGVSGLTFTIETPSYDPHPITAEFLKAAYAKVGVTANIHVITANEWYTKVYQQHDFQATLQEHVNHRDIGFYGNPDFYWGYANAKVTELLNAAEASETEAGQAENIRAANRIIVDEAASNWLFLYPQIVVSKAGVTGYPVNGLNAQFYLSGIAKAD